MRQSFAIPVLMLFFFAVSSTESLSQTYSYYAYQSVDTAFVFSPESRHEAIDLYFPIYNNHPSLHSAIRISGEANIRFNKKNSVRSEAENYVFARLFTSNVKKLLLAAPQEPDKVLLEVKFDRDGYQIVTENKVAALLDLLATGGSCVRLAYELLNPDNPFQLVVGEFWIGSNVLHKALSPSRIFQKYPFDNAARQSTYDKSAFDSYGLYSHFPEDQSEEEFKGVFFIEDQGKKPERLLNEVVYSFLEHYPFYGEKNINRKELLLSVKKFSQAHAALKPCDYADALNNYIRVKLKDPHFVIKSNCKKASAGATPVYAAVINGDNYVAAVLDEKLKEQIPLDSKIIKLNTKRVARFRRSQADLNQLLRKAPGENVNLKIKTAQGETRKVSYSVEEKYRIPENFKPKNLKYKAVNDSVAYYKINRIDFMLPLDFVSLLDDLNKKSKLILDFRGNGGGDILAGAQFVSYFINSSFRYFDLQNVNTHQLDSVVVRPNATPFRYRSDAKIILLIDEGTACTAELCVNALRNYRKNVLVVGKSHSMGALSIAYQVLLPDGTSITTNALNTIKIVLDGQVIEGTGLRPDVLVPVESVYDLQPYQDKVLKTAIAQ